MTILRIYSIIKEEVGCAPQGRITIVNRMCGAQQPPSFKEG